MDSRALAYGNRERRRFNVKWVPSIFLLATALSTLLLSCSSYPGHLWSPPVFYTVGGTISGLSSTGLVLQDNGGNNLPVPTGATNFTFTTATANGGTYNVTVSSQPSSPAQTCTVAGGSGIVAGANVTSIQVTCTTNTYTIGGTITGLTGSGLVLQDNGGNNLTVAAGATSFTFTTPIASGGSYGVTVFSQPSNPTQTCVVTSGSGLVTNANITSVQVACTTNLYTIGGTVSGLTGTGLVLQNNGGNNLAVAVGATSFTFTTRIASGGNYSVRVLAQPSSPAQTCAVTNGIGIVASANVTNVQIVCTNVVPSTKLFAYVSNQLSGTLNAYAVQANGALVPVPGAPFSAGSTSLGVAADPFGKFLYVANTVPDELSGFLIAADGSLSPIPGSPFPTASGPVSVTVDPTGRFVYVVNCGADCSGTGLGNISAFAIGATGALTPIAGSPFVVGQFPYEMAMQSSGDFAYVVNAASGSVSVDTIQPATGALTQIAGSPFAAGMFPISVAITPQNTFIFTVNTQSNNVSAFAIHNDGSLSPVPGSPFSTGTFSASVTVDATGRFAYVAAGAGIFGFSIGSTGNLTSLPGSPFVAGRAPNWISIDPSNHFAYVANTGDGTVIGYTLDSSTGALTIVPGSPFVAGVWPWSIALVSVPQ